MPETPPPDPLATPLAKAPGVSAPLARALEEAFGYRSVRDLVEHYPRRWNPNIQRIRILEGRTPRRRNVCTSCIKANNVRRAV